ncbi:MAG: hypothetical protein ACR2ML_06260 [Solirubrobacteraceae bacterium]
MHGHRTAERRSLEYHRLVADRLDEPLLATARARVEEWIAEGGPVHPVWARRWRAVLDRPAPEIAFVLVTDDEASRDLRQNTPFAGALSPAERWRILREVRD